MRHSLLFVDDEEPLLQAIREFFELRGFAVDCATELDEALALLEARHYAAVISDICLRGNRDAEGLEVVSYIRSYCPDTRIVVLTACTRVEIRERVSEITVDLLLMKPHPLARLASVIDGLLLLQEGPALANAS